MRVVRSFPKVIPPNRTYIVDDLERFYNQDFGYSGIQPLINESAIVLIDWDMAIDQWNLRRFIQHAEANPDWPITVPYYKMVDGEPLIMHFRKTGDGFRHVYGGEPDCDQMGTGICYLPRGILRDCPDSDSGSLVLNDGLISRYLRSLPEWKPIPIMWDVTVTHLH